MPYPDRFYPVVDSVAWVARLALLGVGAVNNFERVLHRLQRIRFA